MNARNRPDSDTSAGSSPAEPPSSLSTPSSLTAADLAATLPRTDGESPDDDVQEVDPDKELPPEPASLGDTVKTILVGKPLNIEDKAVHQHISLIAFLAWVGLGADGLSSSCYGPAEAFLHLRGHEYLAIGLAAATVFTVFVISKCYSHIIEAFPSGGGGYLVASKMLGSWVGALSGCALVVDYVLTVTVSIAAAGDAFFGLAGLHDSDWKLWVESATILGLIVLNLRGAKESINFLLPIFLVFLVTHAILIAGVLGMHVSDIGPRSAEIAATARNDVSHFGWLWLIGTFLKAYSLGAGTYTGIEAVSNSMPVMREPRVATAKRTMVYMAISLAITAGGLMLAYLLLRLEAEPGGPTMNTMLTERFVHEALPWWAQQPFLWITILSESALLIVAAQAGFIGGPKCLANMAHDSWVPHWFGSLSERLASHNGILLIGVAGMLALWGADGKVSLLVILYSINVFLTFTLSMLGMSVLWYKQRTSSPIWRRRFALFVFGAILCGSILAITVIFKFEEGAWKTVLVTGAFTGLCLVIQRYYRNVSKRLKGLDETLGTIEISGSPTTAPLDVDAHTAVILVGGYSGLGVHTLLNSIRFVPHHFKQMVFVSVGVADSGNFKGAEAIDDLKRHTEVSLEKYVLLARRLGFPARGYLALGTDVVDELEQLCRVVHRDYPKSVVFAGQLVFQRETWYGAILHNQTAYSLQRRLQWDGIPMVILPTRVREPV
jgi:amino acid transporter